jgi:hypothetical protein
MKDEIARSAGTDAANRSMKAAQRKTWRLEDYNSAVQEYLRIMGEE